MNRRAPDFVRQPALPQPALPAGPYDVVLADPPWQYVSWGPKGNYCGAEKHYRTMTTPEIAALPVGALAAENAVLFLWVVNNRIPDALRVMESWGFAYKTVGFTWVKTDRKGDPVMSLGYYTRSNVELVLIGVRGQNPKCGGRNGAVPGSGAVHSVIQAPRGPHSRKPDELYARIDQMLGPAGTGAYPRRLELFARRAWDGWSCWGNQAPVAVPTAEACCA